LKNNAGHREWTSLARGGGSPYKEPPPTHLLFLPPFPFLLYNLSVNLALQYHRCSRRALSSVMISRRVPVETSGPVPCLDLLSAILTSCPCPPSLPPIRHPSPRSPLFCVRRSPPACAFGYLSVPSCLSATWSPAGPVPLHSVASAFSLHLAEPSHVYQYPERRTPKHREVSIELSNQLTKIATNHAFGPDAALTTATPRSALLRCRDRTPQTHRELHLPGYLRRAYSPHDLSRD
jgi:hypothetical protein